MKIHNKKSVKFIFGLAFLTVAYFNGLAQIKISPLFTTVEKDAPSIDNAQKEFFDKSEADENTVYQKLVKIGDVQSFLENGVVSFQFPNISDVLTAKTNYTTQSEKEGLVWNGVFPDDKGDITIISKDGAKYGGITYGDHYCSFEDIGRATALVREVVTPADGHGSDFRVDKPLEPQAPLTWYCEDGPTDKEIDVLFLFTEEAGTLAAMQQKSNATIVEMNLIAKNSKAQVHFNNVGTKPTPIPNYGKPLDPKGFNKGDVTKQATNAGNILAFKNLREQEKADIVIILYKAPTKYIDAKGTVFGACGGFGKKTSYVMAHVDYVINSKYQIAMLGAAELIGAGSEVTSGLYPYSKPKIYGSKYTVVHSGVPQNKSKYISNPKVKDGSVATGTTNEKDNVLTINKTACQVRDYFTKGVDVIMNIQPYSTSLCKSKPLKIDIFTSGLEPSEYCISVSTDGINYSIPICQKNISNKNSNIFNIAASNSDKVYIKAVVYEANGYFKKTSTVITRTNCFDNLIPTLNRQAKTNTDIKAIFITPNPAKDDFSALITGFQDQNVKMNILDAKSSNIVFSIDKNVNSNEYYQDFNTSNLPDSIYFLQLISDETIITKKIIVTHD